MSHEISGQRWLGLACIAGGIPWVYSSIRYLIGVWSAVGFDGGQAFLILIVLGGLAVLLFGLSQFVYREVTTIDAAEVRHVRTGLTGKRTWTEPVRNYRGIVQEQRYESGSETHTPAHHGQMVYSICLDHADRRRKVRLYESANTLEFPGPEWNLLRDRYAELLGMTKIANRPD